MKEDITKHYTRIDKHRFTRVLIPLHLLSAFFERWIYQNLIITIEKLEYYSTRSLRSVIMYFTLFKQNLLLKFAGYLLQSNWYLLERNSALIYNTSNTKFFWVKTGEGNKVSGWIVWQARTFSAQNTVNFWVSLIKPFRKRTLRVFERKIIKISVFESDTHILWT